MRFRFWFFLLLIVTFHTAAHPPSNSTDRVEKRAVDFIHYRAELTPDIQLNHIKGKVDIEFVAIQQQVSSLRFTARYKKIFSVSLDNKPAAFRVEGDTLLVSFGGSLPADTSHTLSVAFQSSAERGMKFYDDHMFSVYHTKNWLIAHENIDDKATFELIMTHAPHLSLIGNGQRVSETISGDAVVSHWHQRQPVPIYTFGFALGEFEQVTHPISTHDVTYYFRKRNLSSFEQDDALDVFKDVPDMLSFFEQKAGFALPGGAYRFVIVDGYMAQEASGFSLVGEKFVAAVQHDPHENWFIAHELAHEWWGNSVTCANFSHFWLNEGLVQFLVAAYKEHRFGKAAYDKEIGIAVKRVQSAIARDDVAAVAFRQPIDESEINRTMAYSKGALVFHMLRNELGDALFWKALKTYTMKYKGKSVTTAQLKATLEEVSDRNLTAFFETWVYGEAMPDFVVTSLQDEPAGTKG